MSETHYLDYAATSPLLPAAHDAWEEAQRTLRLTPGNPASLHSGGRAARRMLEDAREKVAHYLGAQRAEVVFTSGATESCALAVVGGARGVHKRDPKRSTVVASRVDHDAVTQQLPVLEERGFTSAFLPVSNTGVSIMNEEDIASDSKNVALYTLPIVSSEIGTYQPVEELVRILSALNDPTALSRPLVHTDAAQALLTYDVNFSSLGVDMLSLGGHKIGGPVGIGVLLVKRGVPLISDRPGGGHERGIRSGTPDVAGAASLAAALAEGVSQRGAHCQHMANLREHLLQGLPADVQVTVPQEAASPAIVHLSLPTLHPEAVLMAMDMAGVWVSAGTACHAGVTRPSQIVMALGRSQEQALGVLRVSMGPLSTKEDIDAFLRVLPQALAAGQALDRREQKKTVRAAAAVADSASWGVQDI
ncbi:MAG: aminotransferase [Actinobacteria bacterium]|nr:MAG: aminotransferase [Actinomycetota bacterium]